MSQVLADHYEEVFDSGYVKAHCIMHTRSCSVFDDGEAAAPPIFVRGDSSQSLDEGAAPRQPRKKLRENDRITIVEFGSTCVDFAGFGGHLMYAGDSMLPITTP